MTWVVLSSPTACLLHTLHHGANADLEPHIATDASSALSYAENVLKGPFSLGEPAIARDSKKALKYARTVLNGPFPLGEPAMALDADVALCYALQVRKGRFPLAEDTIAQDPAVALVYARNFLKRPFLQAEPFIFFDKFNLTSYLDYLKGSPKKGDQDVWRDSLLTASYFLVYHHADQRKARFTKALFESYGLNVDTYVGMASLYSPDLSVEQSREVLQLMLGKIHAPTQMHGADLS